MTTIAATPAWPLHNVQMPDFDGKTPNWSSWMLLNRVFRGGGPEHRDAYGLAMNFVRIADRIADEYKSCRDNFLAFANNGTQSLAHGRLLAAISDLESCIYNMRRAYNLAMGARKFAEIEPLVLPLPSPTDAVLQDLNGIRNRITHFDEDLADGILLPNAELCLQMRESGFFLSSFEMTYEALFALIKGLCDVAEQLASYVKSTSPLVGGSGAA